jgi:hypothetical protein
VTSIDRLVELFAGHYRWGLHPLKVLIALLLPVAMIWIADRRVRVLDESIAERDRTARRLPRTRRR